MGFIWVVHESLEGAEPVQVDQEAFDLVWRIRGFVECDAPVDDDAETALAVEELRQALAAAGEPAPVDEFTPDPAPAKASRKSKAPAPAASSGDEKE